MFNQIRDFLIGGKKEDKELLDYQNLELRALDFPRYLDGTCELVNISDEDRPARIDEIVYMPVDSVDNKTNLENAVYAYFTEKANRIIPLGIPVILKYKEGVLIDAKVKLSIENDLDSTKLLDKLSDVKGIASRYVYKQLRQNDGIRIIYGIIYRPVERAIDKNSYMESLEKDFLKEKIDNSAENGYCFIATHCRGKECRHTILNTSTFGNYEMHEKLTSPINGFSSMDYIPTMGRIESKDFKVTDSEPRIMIFDKGDENNSLLRIALLQVKEDMLDNGYSVFFFNYSEGEDNETRLQTVRQKVIVDGVLQQYTNSEAALTDHGFPTVYRPIARNMYTAKVKSIEQFTENMGYTSARLYLDTPIRVSSNFSINYITLHPHIVQEKKITLGSTIMFNIAFITAFFTSNYTETIAEILAVYNAANSEDEMEMDFTNCVYCGRELDYIRPKRGCINNLTIPYVCGGSKQAICICPNAAENHDSCLGERIGFLKTGLETLGIDTSNVSSDVWSIWINNGYVDFMDMVNMSPDDYSNISYLIENRIGDGRECSPFNSYEDILRIRRTPIGVHIRAWYDTIVGRKVISSIFMLDNRYEKFKLLCVQTHDKLVAYGEEDGLNPVSWCVPWYRRTDAWQRKYDPSMLFTTNIREEDIFSLVVKLPGDRAITYKVVTMLLLSSIRANPYVDNLLEKIYVGFETKLLSSL